MACETTKIRVGSINVRITFEIQEDCLPLDISTASSKTIVIRKPDGINITVAAIFSTDGTDGLIYYDSVNGDFDSAGTYKVQAIIIIGSGTYPSDIKTFSVACNL